VIDFRTLIAAGRLYYAIGQTFERSFSVNVRNC